MDTTTGLESIKNTFVSLRTFFLVRKKKFVRNTQNYLTAKKVGVLFGPGQEMDYQALRDFITTLQEDGKDVHLLIFGALPLQPAGVDVCAGCNCHFFSFKDISLFGRIKKQEIKSFAAHTYDYLCCVSCAHYPVFEQILRSTPSLCRIGNYHLPSKNLFEMSVESRPSNVLSTSFDDILRYWKNISKN